MPVESYPAPLQLNVHDILRTHAPRIPGFVASLIARLVRQEELNRLLRRAFPAAGSSFAGSILHQLQINLRVSGTENIPAHKPLVFASNHPLGGLDGIALIALLGNRLGDDNITFPVNDMLMRVRPLCNLFIPVNKYGRQGRSRAAGLQQAFAGNKHIIIFPAGLVSRKSPAGIRDLEWRKTFVTHAAATNRTIVPVRFGALNRARFYRLAQWRQRLHIPVNLEQVLLPSELVHCKKKSFGITFLPPLDARALLASYPDARSAAAAIRSSLYRSADKE